jgi:protocatechuate 3,4-dioxygenase beta subunit
MNNTSKLVLLLVILLLAGAAVGVSFMLEGESGGELPPQIDLTTPTEATGASLPIQTDGSLGRMAAEPRVELAEPTTTSGSQYGQGITGTVIDPAGIPVNGAQVYLMEGSMSNIFQRVTAMQEGVVFPPTAADKTDALGQFALGLRETVPGTVYEVRILTERFMDHRIPNLTIKDGDWYDAKRIKLEAGTMVHGRVTVEGQGWAVPGATIYISARGSFPTIAPTPGRDQGLEVQVNDNGYFQVQNAPKGIVEMSAAAPYFARVYRRGVNLDPMVANEVNFELARGLAIRGMVTDPTGLPVGGARVMATSLLPKQPQSEEARTDGDGRFEFLSLVEAPFQLTAMARGFQRQDEKPVQAGAEDVLIVLEKQGSAHVKVWGRNNRLLRSYALNVKSHFAGQNQIGNVQGQSPRNIRPFDLDDGFATAEGLNPGNYVFQVDAPGHARTFSEPFTVGPGIQPPALELHLSMGGTILGVVRDRNGRPVRGVAVQTQVDGMVENAFLSMLGPMIPKKITEMSVQTDGEGRFRFNVMAKGTYQLKFTHPEFCDEVQKGLTVEEGTTTDVPPVTLVAGTLITGTTLVDGVATGQIKVSIQIQPPEQGNLGPGAFHADAVSDSLGQFVISRRLPPGAYHIQATRQPENPFAMIADYEKTRRTFTVGLGQVQLRLDINVPSR